MTLSALINSNRKQIADLTIKNRLSEIRPDEQSEDKGTDKPDGPEPHNGLLYCYEGTNITGKKAVKDAKTQLNDALIAFGLVSCSSQSFPVDQSYLITLVAL